MNPITVDALQRRLDRLERQNRRWRGGAAALLLSVAGVFLMGQVLPRGVPKLVEAEEFILRDASGTIRARLGLSESAGASLHLAGSDGKIQAILAVTPHAASLTLAPADMKPRITLGAGADGLAEMIFFDARGGSGGPENIRLRLVNHPALYLSDREKMNGAALMALRDATVLVMGGERAPRRAVLSASPERGVVGLSFHDEKHNPRLELGVSRIGVPHVRFNGEDGRARILLGVPETGLPWMYLFDNDERAVFKAP